MKTQQYLTAAVVAIALACTPKPAKEGKKTRKPAVEDPAKTPDEPEKPKKVFRDPTKVTVEFSGAPTSEVADAISESLQTPTLSISFSSQEAQQASYAILIRCAGSYRLKTLDGREVSTLDGSETSRKLKKGAWQRALAESRYCRILYDYAPAGKFFDYAAEAGTHQYIANPCVFNTDSTTGKEGCSYQLAVSAPITFEGGGVKEEQRKAMEELSKATGEMVGIQAELRALAEGFASALQACQEHAAVESSYERMRKGLLGALAAGPMYAISPTSAPQWIPLTSMTVDLIIGHKVLGLPLDDETVGADPEAAARAEKKGSLTVTQKQQARSCMSTFVEPPIPPDPTEKEGYAEELEAYETALRQATRNQKLSFGKEFGLVRNFLDWQRIMGGYTFEKVDGKHKLVKNEGRVHQAMERLERALVKAQQVDSRILRIDQMILNNGLEQ